MVMFTFGHKYSTQAVPSIKRLRRNIYTITIKAAATLRRPTKSGKNGMADETQGNCRWGNTVDDCQHPPFSGELQDAAFTEYGRCDENCPGFEKHERIKIV